MLRRVLLVDRDGVLNRNREGYVRTPGELEVLPGAGEALRQVREAGYLVAVVTNQAGVGKGIIAPATLAAIHARLQTELALYGGAVDRFYVCPHRPEDRCGCRKPKPGLIEQARAELGFDPAATWFVGDAARDVQAGKASSCKPALVRTGINDFGIVVEGVPVFDDLLAFVERMLSGCPGTSF